MVIYQEKQKFGAFYTTILLVAIAGLCALTVYELWRREVEWIHFLAPLVSVTFLIYLLSLTLTTRILPDAIQVGFPLWPKRTIAREDIDKAYIRQYSPLHEYGGWGYRVGPNGKAYNAMGEMGLQLELRDGSRILIGTQRPEQLRQVIQHWMER